MLVISLLLLMTGHSQVFGTIFDIYNFISRWQIWHLTRETGQKRNVIDSNSDFLKLCKLFPYFKTNLSISASFAKTSVRPVLPFLPFPPFRTPGHRDMKRRTTNSVTTNIKQWMLPPPPLKCLDKTQIRGYSTDTQQTMRAIYTHRWCLTLSQIVTLGMIRDNCLVTMFDSYYPESTHWWPIMGLFRLKPHQSLPLKAI